MNKLLKIHSSAATDVSVYCVLCVKDRYESLRERIVGNSGDLQELVPVQRARAVAIELEEPFL